MTGSRFTDDLLVDIEETAKLLTEIEDQRKRVVNRRGFLTRSEPDSDGMLRGRCQPESSPTVMMLDDYLSGLADQEVLMTKRLEKAMRKHPLASWVTAQRGLGYKSIGRLLACLEDPSWHPVEERPRTFAELKSYCGVVPGYKRVRGVSADQADQWNGEAKMRLYVIADSAYRQKKPSCARLDEDRPYLVSHVDTCRCGPYRLVYEQRRLSTEDKLHTVVCRPCGPSGHPALPGSPWSRAHQHGDGLRFVGQRILRDLWGQARTYNGFTDEVVTAT